MNIPLIALFLMRRESRETSHHFLDWIIPVFTVAFSFSLRIHLISNEALHTFSYIIQAAGVAAVIVSLASIGRSFGIVPANRIIKSSGAYRFIRHPVYAGELTFLFGFITRVFPDLSTLDEISYRAIMIGFPIFTMGALIFGAIWAKFAWGDYWSWNPKETWSLITFIVYALYLHARITYGWKGRAAAWVSIIGFLATMFTLFGVNYLLSGLHSYA